MHFVPSSCKCKKVVLFALKLESFGGKSHYKSHYGLEMLFGKQNHSRRALVFQDLQVKIC